MRGPFWEQPVFLLSNCDLAIGAWHFLKGSRDLRQSRMCLFFSTSIYHVSLCMYVYIYYVTDYTVYRYYYIYNSYYYYRYHIASCWSPFFNKTGDRLVSQIFQGIRANSRLLRTLPSKLPCTTVTKPWHVEKQCHEPPIWEWVIPPIKMVKLGMVYIFHQHSCLFFCKGALHPILESCLARHSPHIQWSHPGPWHLPKCEGTQKHLNGIAFSTTAWQEKIGDTHKQPFDWGTSW